MRDRADHTERELETRQPIQRQLTPSQEMIQRRIDSGKEKLKMLWVKLYQTNPERPRFERRQKEIQRLIDTISKEKQRLGTFSPTWSIEYHEHILHLIETKQL